MKLALAAAVMAALVVPGAALAQEAPATQDAPATPDAPAPAAKFSLDTPIETIVADEKGKAVLDADIPGLVGHPSYDQFKGMTLRQLQPFSGGLLTDDMLTKVETDLTALK